MDNISQTINYLSIDVQASEQSIKRMDDMVLTITRLTPQLKQHPDPQAYQALVDAIAEVVKTWEATNAAITEVWQLYKMDGDLKPAEEGLDEIGNFNLLAKVRLGKGHCTKIWAIYENQLATWFSQALSAADQDQLQQIFVNLNDADETIFRDMINVAAHTDTVANNVLALVQNDQPDEARRMAKDLWQQLRPLRTSINLSLVELEQVQAQFSTLIVPHRPVASAAPEFWNGWLAKEFHDCLMKTYDSDSTRMMLRFKLDRRLGDLVKDGGFRDVAFNLIEVAEQEGWIVELVQAAHNYFPENQVMADFAQKVETLEAEAGTATT